MATVNHAHQLLSGGGRTGRILLLWYFICIFTVFSMQVGNQLITCFYAFPAAVLMLQRNIRYAKSREFLPLFLLIAIALISVVFGYGESYMGDRFKSWILFVYTISMAYAMRLELGRANNRDISWFTGWLLFGILAAAIFEVLGPLQPLSDAFRAWNSPRIYTANDRDLILAGFLRPKVFTQEPSYAAIAVAVFSFAWYNSTTNRHKHFWIGLTTSIAIFLFRSPTSLIAIAPIALLFLNRVFKKQGGRQRALIIFFALFVFLVLSTVGYFVIISFLDARSNAGGSFGDQSLKVRLISPPRIAARIIGEAPFLGAGIGGREAILPQILVVFSEMGIETSFLSASIEDSIPNAFWEHWIYFGGIGGVIGGAVILFFFRQLAGSLGFVSILFLFLLFNSMGAYSAPRIWSFSILAVISIGSQKRESVSTPIGQVFHSA